MYSYGDVLKEVETGRVAIVEYGACYSTTYLIKFIGGEKFQIDGADLESKFKKVKPICPKCGRVLDISDLDHYVFLCEHCDENFYSMEVHQFV